MRDPDPLLRRLKLGDLRLFSAVVGAGGMAKAATQLHISQPAVSKAIASLEQTLGVRLLDRHAGGVTPTIYGEALLQGSTAVFDDLGQSVGRIKFLNDPRNGKVRFGCSHPIALGFVPGVIERMSADYPGIRFEVFDTDDIASLKRRQIEFAITRRFLGHEDVEVHEEVLFDDPLVVYAASDSPWARRRKISLADLIDAPWSIPFYNSPVGRLIVEAFRADGLEPPRAHVKSFSIDVHLGLLATGKYVSIAALSMLRTCSQRLSIKALPIKLKHRPSSVAIMTLRDRTLSPVAELFIKYAHGIAKPLAAPC
jgi:DNA-binding transcriptional LysR family regulator